MSWQDRDVLLQREDANPCAHLPRQFHRLDKKSALADQEQRRAWRIVDWQHAWRRLRPSRAVWWCYKLDAKHGLNLLRRHASRTKQSWRAACKVDDGGLHTHARQSAVDQRVDPPIKILEH